MELTLREIIQSWANENGFYEFSHRVAFVPEEILERLMFEIPTKAEEILENEGY
jgi:hypothetical protein